MARPLDFAALVHAHQKGVWRYLRFLGCEPSRADDLAQETFLTVLRRPFAAESDAAAAAYLRQVARHLFLDVCRRERREMSMETLDRADQVWSDYGEPDGGEAYLEGLRECLQSLDERSREVLQSRYGGGRTRGALAREFGVAAEGAKTLLRRAKDRLRACVEGKLRHD